MRNSARILFLTIFFLPFEISAQTGLYVYNPTGALSSMAGTSIVPSNDGHLVAAFSDTGGEEIMKLDDQGNVIWTYTAILYSPYSIFVHKLIPVPGEGYYYFSYNSCLHVNEDGSFGFLHTYLPSEAGFTTADFDGDFTFQDAVYTGTDFHVLTGQFKMLGAVDTALNKYALLQLDLGGAIAGAHLFDADTVISGGLYDCSLMNTGGYDYVIRPDKGFAYPSLVVDKIADGAATVASTEAFGTFYIPKGTEQLHDGYLEYGADVSGVGPLKIKLIKRSFAGDTLWTKITIIDPGGMYAGQQIADLVELDSHNLLALCSIMDADFIIRSYKLVLLSPMGDLLNISDVFYSYDQTYGYTGLNDMVKLGFNQIGFVAQTPMYDGIVLITDTTGNYYHTILRGQLFNDVNGNIICDAGEVTFGDQMIVASPMPYYAYTHADGTYDLFIGSMGDHTINAPDIDAWDIISPDDHYAFTVDSTMTGDTIPGFDFRYDYTAPVYDVQVTAHTAQVKPGFVTWNDMTIKNIGNQYGMSGTASLHFPGIFTFTGSDPVYDILSDTVIIWNYAGLDPMESITYHAEYVADAGAVVGTFANTTAIADALPADDDTTNNIFTAPEIVVAAIDPNHKTVLPAGLGVEGAIDTSTTDLIYTIDFQNTGNAPASFVDIYDTLDTDLVLTTVEMLSASHPYALFITAPNVLHWHFSPIVLTDSAADFAASVGYVMFKVKIQPGSPVGTVIHNSVAIYFDYNPPVFTNTVTNTLEVMSPITASAGASTTLHIFPSPATTMITIDAGSILTGSERIEFYSITGKRIFIPCKKNGAYTFIADVTSCRPGLYICTILDRNQNAIGRGNFEVVK